MKEITGAGHYGFLIEVTAKKIKQSLQKRLNDAKIDLTVDQWVVLDHIINHNGVSQNALADKVFKDAPTVTRIIDILCKKGMIERKSDSKDRRRFNLFIKEDGSKMIEMAEPVVLLTRKAGWNDLSESDYQHLVRILSAINRNFRNHNFFTNGLDHG